MKLETLWREKWKRGVLEIPQCRECAAWNWYPLPACRSCHATAFEWKSVRLAGTLYSWTRVHRDFTGRGIETPYLVGLVDVGDAPGVRIPCRIRQREGEDPEIGTAGSLCAVGDADQWHWRFESATAGAMRCSDHLSTD